MKGYLLTISDITLLANNCSLGYVVRGKAGQTVTSYLESITFFDLDVPECDKDMTHDGTINSIACGTEPIVVGSFNTAVSYKSIDGATYGINDFSMALNSETKRATYPSSQAMENWPTTECCLTYVLLV